MDRSYSTLERALAELAVELVLIFEDLPEDQIELDTAVKLQESIRQPFRNWTQRRRLDSSRSSPISLASGMTTSGQSAEIAREAS